MHQPHCVTAVAMWLLYFTVPKLVHHHHHHHHHQQQQQLQQQLQQGWTPVQVPVGAVRALAAGLSASGTKNCQQLNLGSFPQRSGLPLRSSRHFCLSCCGSSRPLAPWRHRSLRVAARGGGGGGLPGVCCFTLVACGPSDCGQQLVGPVRGAVAGGDGGHVAPAQLSCQLLCSPLPAAAPTDAWDGAGREVAVAAGPAAAGTVSAGWALSSSMIGIQATTPKTMSACALHPPPHPPAPMLVIRAAHPQPPAATKRAHSPFATPSCCW
jgi:hypothetical protein